MTTWNHVKNDYAYKMLSGVLPATKENIHEALSVMLKEQADIADNKQVSDVIFWGRADALDRAIVHYKMDDLSLCMNRIKTFYLT